MWLNTIASTDRAGNGSAAPSAQTNGIRPPNRCPARRQPGLVDVHPGDQRAGVPQLVGDEAGGAAEVEHPQAGEVGPAEEVREHRDDLAALARRSSSTSILDWSSE